MPNRVNASKGQRAWYQGTQLGNGQFLPASILSYWIEAFATPTAEQRAAGRKTNIPVVVPVSASWTKGFTQSLIAEMILAAEAMDPMQISYENAYALSLSVDPTDELLDEADEPIPLGDDQAGDDEILDSEPAGDEPYIIDEDEDDGDDPIARPAR